MTPGRPRWLLPAFWVALVLAAAFAGFAIWSSLRLPDTADGPIEAWMTPGYVVHVYHVDPDRAAEILGVGKGEARGKTLSEIAEVRGVPVAGLVSALQAAVPAKPGQ